MAVDLKTVAVVGGIGVLLFAALASRGSSPGRSRRRQSGAFVCKGFAVSFVMENGRTVKAPASYAFLHDTRGRVFPRCVGVVAPFKTVGDDVENDDARDYFGGYDPREGTVTLPPRSSGAWKHVGRVAEILYTRRRPGRLPSQHRARYYHPIESGNVTLYRIGNVFRVEMGPNCEWNARGIVRP